MNIVIEFAKVKEIKIISRPFNFSIDLLPSVPIGMRHLLPRCNAVYFLVGKKNKVLYVGQSRNLKQRIGLNHHCKAAVAPLGNECRIAWIPMDALGTYAEVTHIEAVMINHLKPELNKYIPKVIPVKTRRGRAPV